LLLKIQLEAATLDVLILPFYMDPISTLITWVRWDLSMSKDYLLAMAASGFGVPIRAASCCSTALESKYANHAAASCHKPGTKQDTEEFNQKKRHIRSKWDYQREEAQGLHSL
jgi:hypothetical protein